MPRVTALWTISSDKMLDILNTFQKGSEYDAALRNTYGIDMDKLNDQWKIWVTKLYTGG
jgi:hypothetical protein